MWKFLGPSGCTLYDGEYFPYTLPRPDQKWGDSTEHPDPAEPDGSACGPGRLHLMKHLDARHAPRSWWPWYARGVGEEIGSDTHKAAYAAVELRRITPKVFWRCLRPPFNWGGGANLREANLYEADLREADLSGANLREADLGGANLREANLYGANLGWADLSGANLREADLGGANLGWANLYEANLYGAYLRGANLYEANLREADLYGANLYGANLGWADLGGANLGGANLYEANLYGAYLRGAIWNRHTIWPAGFEPPKGEESPCEPA